MADTDKITVEVAYALPEQQKILTVEVDDGATALDAAQASGITRVFPGLELEHADMGVFGKTIKPRDYQLRAGDRVEIYRPLIADPKEVRKKRAAKAQAKKDAE